MCRRSGSCRWPSLWSNWRNELRSFRRIRLCLLSVALRLLLNLLLLRWVFGNDRDKISRNGGVKLEAISKLLQIVQLNFLIIPGLSGSELINILSLLSSETLESDCNILLYSCGGIWSTFRPDVG